MIQFSVQSCFDNQNLLKQKALPNEYTYKKDSNTNSAANNCYEFFNLVSPTTVPKNLLKLTTTLRISLYKT